MENKTKPTISKAEFTQFVNEGWSKQQLADKYQISTASVKEIAKTLGLTIKRAVAPKYILTDDVVETTTANTITYNEAVAAFNN